MSQVIVSEPDRKEDIPFEKLVPNHYQPRFLSNESVKDLQELAANIKENGLQHRVRVRALENGKYEVFEGHRRTAAIKSILGLTSIPCEVYEEMDDKTMYCRIWSADKHKSLDNDEIGYFLIKGRELFKSDEDQMKELDNMAAATYYERKRLADADLTIISLAAQNNKIDSNAFLKNRNRPILLNLATIKASGDQKALIEAAAIVCESREKALEELPKIAEMVTLVKERHAEQKAEQVRDIAKKIASEPDPVKREQMAKEEIMKSQPGKPFQCVECGAEYYLELKDSLLKVHREGYEDIPIAF